MLLLIKVYGACASILGAALPQIAIEFAKSESEFGVAFTFRGIGYLLGTLGSAAILNMKSIKLSKEFLASLCVALNGSMMLCILLSRNYFLVLLFFGIQGIGFGMT